MRAFEHRAIGDIATGSALVNLGGDPPEEHLFLSFGDVIALSGDFFQPGEDPSDGLFALARVPGAGGRRLGTRDEVLCALKVATVDESYVDPRFEPGGRFAATAFSRGADRSDVERRARDRHLGLAATNDDHFVAPGRSDVPTGSGYGSARSAYRGLHEVALDHAWAIGRAGGDLSRAMAREAAAQHYLTDAFAAGHLRTPVADIRRYWRARYPGFWEHLQARVASDTASALRGLSPVMGLLPAQMVRRRTLAELRSRTEHYPELSAGDLVARCFHDWDNTHGLAVEGGGVVFGDGHLDEGDTRRLAVAAVRAGNDDVEVAFELGRTGRAHRGRTLYEAVREATGAGGGAFVPETRLPRLADANSPQNWLADDVEELWASPVVGTTGTTVGEALTAMLEPDGEFIGQLERLGHGLAGAHGVLSVPLVGGWLRDRCCQAYHDGFVAPLARDPRPVLLDLVHDACADPTINARRTPCPATSW